MTPLPPDFVARMTAGLGAESGAFLAALVGEPTRALRVNPAKVTLAEVTERLGIPADPVPWCADATHLPAGVLVGDSVEHRAGFFYLQEPSAMAVVESLDIEPHHYVLDIAAAPGGKATHAASYLGDDGFLLVNEVVQKRLGPLLANLDAWGYRNVAVASTAPGRIAEHLPGVFDRVIVDAPCSGEALFRRDPSSRTQWSAAGVRGAARRQRKLLASASRAMRPGGLLAYATCTFGAEENAEQVDAFLATHEDWQRLGDAVQLWPHRDRCEGQFVAVLRAPEGPESPVAQGKSVGDRVPQVWRDFATATLRRRLGPVVTRGESLFMTPPYGELPQAVSLRPGLPLGRILGSTLRPSHALAMALRPEEVVLHEAVEGAELAAFRSGQQLWRPGERGWVLVTWEGRPLGWGYRKADLITPRLPGHARQR